MGKVEKTKTIDDVNRVILVGRRVMVRRPRKGRALASVVSLDDYLAERKAEKKRGVV